MSIRFDLGMGDSIRIGKSGDKLSIYMFRGGGGRDIVQL